jgi:tetratricopeptide (TPR) repeat protein
MSRVGDWDEPPDYDNAGELWAANAARALKGKRGRAALRDLREALLHLPEKRLIARALCTVGAENRRPKSLTHPDGTVHASWSLGDFNEVVEQEGEGVCAVGAYVWWKKVKAGADPEEAFAALPTLLDADTDISETAYEGQKAGMTYTLAWELAFRNDGTYEALTPELRYEAFLNWLDKAISDEHPLPAL